jgi:hypothetical protein
MTQTVPEYSGCPWPIDPACLGDEWETLDQSIKDRSVALASSTLYRLTGYQVGGCPITVRPCKSGCIGEAIMPIYFSGAGQWMRPHIGISGLWVNSCGCTTDCSCTVLCEVDLPGPVGRVDEVAVDGIIIDPADYRVDNSTLVWVGDTDCPWPTCQDLSKPDTEPNTFSVTYLNSYPVDALGAYAAGTLAWEFAQACVGNKCRLPATVTSISRQGVSMEIAAGSFPDGFTGIREVDAYIALWNPQAIRQRATVWSPDVHSPRVMR